jgi:hypothetical protein
MMEAMDDHQRLDVAIYPPGLAEAVGPDPDSSPAPVAEGVFEGFGFGLLGYVCDGIGHSFVAAELILLCDVIERTVAVLVFDVVKSPVPPSR